MLLPLDRDKLVVSSYGLCAKQSCVDGYSFISIGHM